MQGITPTEYSNIRDLYNTVFPYMQSLGFNIAQVWDEAGKSAFKEILPVVKALITGVMPGAQTAVDAVNRMLDDVAATNAVGGVEMTDEEMRETAFRSLLDLATTAPVRQVRDHIRPGHTPNLEPLVIRDHERRTIVIDVTEEQWTMYNRLNNGHMDKILFFGASCSYRTVNNELANLSNRNCSSRPTNDGRGRNSHSLRL